MCSQGLQRDSKSGCEWKELNDFLRLSKKSGSAPAVAFCLLFCETKRRSPSAEGEILLLRRQRNRVPAEGKKARTKQKGTLRCLLNYSSSGICFSAIFAITGIFTIFPENAIKISITKIIVSAKLTNSVTFAMPVEPPAIIEPTLSLIL